MWLYGIQLFQVEVTENVGQYRIYRFPSSECTPIRGTSSYCDLTWLQQELAESVVDY